MAWAALLGTALGGYGSYTSGEAAKGDARAQADDARAYQSAYGQYTGWQNQGQTGLYQRQHDLAQQGYRNQDMLGQALGSPNRGATGAAGRATTAQQQAQALGGLYQPNPGRSFVGHAGVGQQWGQDYYNQRQAPSLQARAQMLQQMGGQRAMANYDRNALGTAGDTAVDLGRQSGEASQKENALQAYRQQLLEQAGVNDQYRGPSAGYYNQQLFAQGANLAGQGLLAYSSAKNQPTYGGYGSYGGDASSGGSGASTGSGSYGW